MNFFEIFFNFSGGNALNKSHDLSKLSNIVQISYGP